jgi:ABC-2 type transport system ATP-binding protein
LPNAIKVLYSIETKSLTKLFGDVIAVNDISFSVEKGEIFGFLGPNGAGKSTTMMIFTTLLKPTSGQALISGFDVTTNAKQVRENIGYVQQESTVDEYLTGLFCKQNLTIFQKVKLTKELMRFWN